jgi:phosphoglycerate dehydrogenase-like enzyme
VEQLKVLLMYQPSPSHLQELQAAAPDAQFLFATDEASAAALITDADAVLGNRYFTQSLPQAKRLRWMQSNSTGVDLILQERARLEGVVLTRAAHVYDAELADHAVSLLLALIRGLHIFRDQQTAHRWERRSLRSFSGMQTLVLGWGGVGQAIARRLQSFGFSVEGARRSSVRDDDFVVHDAGTWRQRLPRVDALVLALPLTRETRHLVGSEELGALPPGAFVVNIGRGETIDEAALLQLLQNEHLGGAGLDVFSDEPLRSEHPAWSEPRLLVTPHVGRSPESTPFRWEPIFVENLRRFAAGEQLLHVVDKDRGY